MQNKKKIRPEYLYTALICIAFALAIVIMIVCGSCEPNDEGSGESSVAAESSVPEESAAVSEASSEESVPTSFFTVEVPSAGKTSGLLALTSLPADGETHTEPEGIVKISNYMNGLYGLRDYSLLLHTDAIEALNEMIDEFEDTKGANNLIVFKGYTAPAELEDKTLEADLIGGYTVQFSIYPVDPDNDYLGSGKFLWLVDNCNSFGYIQRYPSEKSEYTHNSGSSKMYRYVGYEHAAYMGKYHLCLEQYLDAVRAYTAEVPLEIAYTDAAGDERTCWVYYVKAQDGEATELPIRGSEGTAYSVSGNGSDGFIVTVYPS